MPRLMKPRYAREISRSDAFCLVAAFTRSPFPQCGIDARHDVRVSLLLLLAPNVCVRHFSRRRQTPVSVSPDPGPTHRNMTNDQRRLVSQISFPSHPRQEQGTIGRSGTARLYPRSRNSFSRLQFSFRLRERWAHTLTRVPDRSAYPSCNRIAAVWLWSARVVACGHSRPDSGDAQAHPIQPAAGAQIESLAVVISPGHVVNVLWNDDRAKMFALGRDHP